MSGTGEPHPELGAWLDDEPVSATDHAELLSHLERCAACRAAVAAKDPSRLFGLLARAPIPPAFADRLSFAVEQALDEQEARPASWRRVRWPAASLAASLVLAGFLTAYVLRRDSPVQAPSPPAAEGPPVAAAARGFELLSSPGQAQVVDLAVGEVQLVMIFDEELDL